MLQLIEEEADYALFECDIHPTVMLRCSPGCGVYCALCMYQMNSTSHKHTNKPGVGYWYRLWQAVLGRSV